MLTFDGGRLWPNYYSTKANLALPCYDSLDKLVDPLSEILLVAVIRIPVELIGSEVAATHMAILRRKYAICARAVYCFLLHRILLPSLHLNLNRSSIYRKLGIR